MTAPFQVITGFLRGRQRRDDVEYEREQDEQARQDRLAAQARQDALLADERRYQRERDAAVEARQRAMDDERMQDRMHSAYNDGFVPLTQLQEQGRQVEAAAQPGPLPDFLGVTTALRAVGQSAQQAKPVYSVGGTPLAKGRNSLREDEAIRAQQMRDTDQREARQFRLEDQQFQAAEAEKNRAGQRQLTGMQIAAQALRGQQPTARQQMPTEGERKASAFYVSGKQGFETLESLLTPGANGRPRAVPSWTGQQLAKVGMGGGNVLTNSETRQLRQAANQLADAWLRFTSGAAVPETEVQRFAQTFVPEPGDDPTTLAQKAASRRTIMQALESAAGRALPNAQQSQGTRPPLGSFQR